MTKGDARCLGENDIPSPGSAPAAIWVNALQTIYREDAFKSQHDPTSLGLKLSRKMPG